MQKHLKIIFIGCSLLTILKQLDLVLKSPQVYKLTRNS